MKVAVGDVLPTWRITVDAAAMKPIALILRDPNPIHWDVTATQAAGLGDRPVNQGVINIAYVANALLAWTGDPGTLRELRLRFLANVFAGDEIEAAGQVTAVESLSAGRRISLDVWLTNGEGARVVAGTACLVLAREDSAADGSRPAGEG